MIQPCQYENIFIPKCPILINPDKLEQIATKAPNHKGNLRLLFIFASWCLGGVNIMPLKAQKLQLSA
jgi:hypothetical protein